MTMFLTQTQLEKEFDSVFYQEDFDKITYDELHLDDFNRERDGYNLIAQPDIHQYLIESFKLSQPKTYQQLLKAEFFYAVEKSPYLEIMDDITQFGFLINNRAFYIKYTDMPYELDKEFIFYKNLPQFILNSWLLRADGWHISESTTTSPFKSRLPTTLQSPIHSIIDDFETKKNRNRYCDFLDSKFNHRIVRDYGDDQYTGDDRDSYFELRNLLDTRNMDDYSSTGFQLFFSSIDNGENIYIIQNADVFSIKRLHNPQEVIDSYAAHIFSGQDGEFDFTPYVVDF